MGRHVAAPRMLARMRGAGALVGTVVTALIIGLLANYGGTYALWNDSTTIPVEATIASGRPALSVTGFEDLDFSYEALGLSTSATVVVTNTGNVRLSGFSAAQTLVTGSSALAQAVSLGFAPAAGGPSVGVGSWLSGLSLAPGASASYTATTTLPALDLALLIGQHATISLTVQAQAGTSWTVAAAGTYSQSVLDSYVPGQDDFNLGFTDWGGGRNWDTFVQSIPSGTPTSAVFYFYINGVLMPDTGTYYYPHFAVSTTNVPAAFRPAPGTTTYITVTVTIDSSPTVIARGTLWLTGVSDTDFIISDTPPAQAETSEGEAGPAEPAQIQRRELATVPETAEPESPDAEDSEGELDPPSEPAAEPEATRQQSGGAEGEPADPPDGTGDGPDDTPDTTNTPEGAVS